MADGRRLTQQVALADAVILGRDLASTLLLERLPSISGPVLIQCGHFSLTYDRGSGKFVPAVLGGTIAFDSFTLRAVRAIGIFPAVSWDLGNSIAVALESAGLSCSLTTIVNDWQLVKSVDRTLAVRLRREFYGGTAFPFFPYSEQIESPRQSFGLISEHSLRRRLERRLKRLVSAQPRQFIWRDRGSGSPGCLYLNAEDGDRLLLRNGKSDCAGEVAELMFMARAAGYQTLINIYPLACLEPVHQGISMAFELEQVALQSSIVVQIGLSCSGEISSEELFSKGVKTTIQTPNGATQSLRYR